MPSSETIAYDVIALLAEEESVREVMKLNAQLIHEAQIKFPRREEGF
jgi:hypothetical protein